MEVAGLVIGATGLTIAALKCFEESQSFIDKVRKKNVRVRSLGRALGGYDAVLTINIDWLLHSIECYEESDELRWTTSLQRPEVVAKARQFLGDAVAKAFAEAILECRDALETVLGSIEGFLSTGIENKNGYLDKINVLKKINFSNPNEIKVRYSQGFKLAMSTRQIEECITKVDRATDILNSIRSAKSNMQWIESRSTQKGPIKKIIRSLTRIRSYADQLHQALSSCWGHEQCLSDHRVNVHLHDRLGSGAEEDSVRFSAIFVSKLSTNEGMIWQESLIQVLKPDDGNDHGESLEGKLSRVKFKDTLTEPSSFQTIAVCEITSICSETCGSHEPRNTVLQLLIQPCPTKRCRIWKMDSSKASQASSADFLTLEDLLRLVHSPYSNLRLYPRDCTELALILASGMLQLSKTPWLTKVWTKKDVHFSKNTSMAIEELRSRDIDITKPLIAKGFPQVSQPAMDTASPKLAVLELAILLLELWHGQTIEKRFSNRLDQVQGDYLDRKFLAQRWLEEDRDLLGFQFDVVASCLQQESDPAWEDEKFLRIFAANVVEPLYRESNKMRVRADMLLDSNSLVPNAQLS